MTLLKLNKIATVTRAHIVLPLFQSLSKVFQKETLEKIHRVVMKPTLR